MTNPENLMPCNICASPTSPLAIGRVLGKYDVQYSVCGQCGFVQTEPPYWLAEAYSEPIIRSDIGLVSRNVTLSMITALAITSWFDADSRFLDYGGGNGMFVRLMRDKGYDFYWYDKYTKNLFAMGFGQDSKQKYEIVTAFEVFEHLPNPLIEIEEMLTHSESILFSTLLVPDPLPKPGDWWYYALDGGQHVALYSKNSLLYLSRRFGLNLYSNGRSLHLLTRKTLSGKAFAALTRGRLAVLFSAFTGRKSLLPDDYFHLTGIKLT